MPGDYNYDGLLDLLIVVLSSHNDDAQMMYYIRSQAEPFFGIDLL